MCIGLPGGLVPSIVLIRFGAFKPLGVLAVNDGSRCRPGHRAMETRSSEAVRSVRLFIGWLVRETRGGLYWRRTEYPPEQQVTGKANGHKVGPSRLAPFLYLNKRRIFEQANDRTIARCFKWWVPS
jgi:hypothetical protein